MYSLVKDFSQHLEYECESTEIKNHNFGQNTLSISDETKDQAHQQTLSLKQKT